MKPLQHRSCRWPALLVAIIGMSTGLAAIAQPPDHDGAPPRRFGLLPTPYVVPLMRNRIVDRRELGRHDSRGHAEEYDGLLYTCGAGFLDLDHVRDAADWTAHVYRRLQSAMHTGADDLNLDGPDRATRLGVQWQRPADATTADANEAAADIAAQLVWWSLTWHEVLTWLGHETLPLISERASAFSYEDNLSHLVGLRIAGRALRRPEPWDDAVTLELDATLAELGALDRDGTLQALERVRDRWWDSHRAWPANAFVMRRHLDIGLNGPIRPWQVHGLPACGSTPARDWPQETQAAAQWQVHAWLESGWAPLRERLNWPPTAQASSATLRIELPEGMRPVLDTITTQVRRELGPRADLPDDLVLLATDVR